MPDVPADRFTRRSVLGLVGFSSLAACSNPQDVVGSSSITRSGTPAATAPAAAAPRAAAPATAAGAPAPTTSVGSSTRTTGPGTLVAGRHTYGDQPDQWADLYLPSGPRKPGTVVVVHGGFWLNEYGADLGAPLAQDLADRGWVAWNVEYRRLGDGGGWPGTFDDMAAAIDHLARLGPELDTSRVVVVGHSAGGQLAAWAGARSLLPADAPGAAPTVPVTGVVSQAGVLDLEAANREGLGGTVVSDLLGGNVRQVPDRYRLGSPQALLPTPARTRCVHSETDGIVPMSQSADYVKAAAAAGSDARLTTVAGDHFALITVGTPAWSACVDAVTELTG